MSELGPDSLREMGRIHTVFAGAPEMGEKIYAHADAWEELEKRLVRECEMRLERIDALEADNAALREEAKTRDEGWFNSIIEVGALRKDNAALRERLEVAGRLVYAALKDVEPHDWPDGFDIVLWHKTQTAEFSALASQTKEDK